MFKQNVYLVDTFFRITKNQKHEVKKIKEDNRRRKQIKCKDHKIFLFIYMLEIPHPPLSNVCFPYFLTKPIYNR